MLESLCITNFAVIERLDVEFEQGLTSITGETGAGKSVLLGALRVALGERASSELVRTGANRAAVEAVFRCDPHSAARAWLEEQGLQDDEAADLIIIRREIPSGTGSSRNFINGRAATLAQVRALGGRLVDFHAQHENARLFSAAEQLALLDSFGDCDDLLAEYRTVWQKLGAARTRLTDMEQAQAEGARRRDYLAFQVDELQRVDPQAGEDEALEAERRRLAHAEKLGRAANEAVDIIQDGEGAGRSVLQALHQASRLLADIAHVDPAQEGLQQDLDNARFALEDVADRLRHYAAGVEAEPERLVEIEDRLDALKTLKRKHGVASVSELAERLVALAEELDTVEHIEEAIAAQRAETEQLSAQALDIAGRLGELRRQSAQEFEKLVATEMADLELPRARFEARVQLRSGEGAAALGPDGADTVEFFVALNVGEPLQPLRRVASGGEVARVMLAVKCVLAACDEVPSLVFDEIDVGISGQAAARVGEKLHALAGHHQVLCITHQAQVAARGNAHLYVEKVVDGGRTRTTVRPLAVKERAKALAHMLAGDQPDAEAMRYAEKLLGKSGVAG